MPIAPHPHGLVLVMAPLSPLSLILAHRIMVLGIISKNDLYRHSILLDDPDDDNVTGMSWYGGRRSLLAHHEKHHNPREGEMGIGGDRGDPLAIGAHPNPPIQCRDPVSRVSP